MSLIITENFGKFDYRLHWRGCGNYSASYIAEEKTKTNFMCPTLCDPMDYSPPGSSVHGILQAKYWSGLPFPFPGHRPNPGIEPRSPALQTDALTSEPPGKPRISKKGILFRRIM